MQIKLPSVDVKVTQMISDLLKKMLKYNPTERLNIKQLLEMDFFKQIYESE